MTRPIIPLKWLALLDALFNIGSFGPVLNQHFGMMFTLMGLSNFIMDTFLPHIRSVDGVWLPLIYIDPRLTNLLGWHKGI